MIKSAFLLRHSFSALAAGALLLSIAAPAAAAEKADKAAEATSASSSDPKLDTKICLSPTVTGQAQVTGSILSKKQCRTKAEWEARGVQFHAK